MATYPVETVSYSAACYQDLTPTSYYQMETLPYTVSPLYNEIVTTIAPVYERDIVTVIPEHFTEITTIAPAPCASSTLEVFESSSEVFESSEETDVLPLDCLGTWGPTVEAVNHEDTIDFEVDVPGAKIEELHIDLLGETLTIKGKHEEHHSENGIDYELSEDRCQGFVHTITVPVGLKPEMVVANLNEGVLVVTVPKYPIMLIQMQEQKLIAEKAASQEALRIEDRVQSEEKVSEEKVSEEKEKETLQVAEPQKHERVHETITESVKETTTEKTTETTRSHESAQVQEKLSA